MFLKHIFFSVLLSFLFITLPAQDKKTGPKEKTFKQELKSNKQLRKEARERKRIAKAERKAIKKYHKRLQTKQVRKRMRSNKKKTARYNDNKREFFLVRWVKNSKAGRKRR